MSKSVIATPTEFKVQIAQQPISVEQDVTRGAAIRAFNEGEILYQKGTKKALREAISKYKLASSIFHTVGDLASEATTLNNIGQVYLYLGDKQQALTYYKKARSPSKKSGKTEIEGSTLNNIGKVYSDLGDRQQALIFFNQALPFRQKGNKGITFNNIGQVYSDLEDRQQALNYFNQARPLSNEAGDRETEAIILNNIGLVFWDLGDKQEALNYFNQALLIDNQETKANILNNIGQYYSDSGDKYKALNYFNQALILADRETKTSTLNNIGQIYADLRNRQKALNYFDRARTLSHEAGDRDMEAIILNNIGLVHWALRDERQAYIHYNKALSLERAVGYQSGEAVTLSNIAVIEQKQGNISAALINIEAAIRIIENLRTKVVSPELRISYLATKQNIYQFKTNLLMQLHKKNPSGGYNALALEVTDRAHARTLVELLTESKIDIREGIKPELLKREQDFKQNYNALEIRRIDLTSQRRTEPELVNFYQKRSNLLQDYRQLQTDIRQYNPQYAALKFPEPLTLKQIQQQVLDNDTILLAYSLGTERSYLWLVSKTKIESYELPKRSEIEKQAKYFYNEQEREPEKPVHLDKNNLIGVQLSKVILQPIANKLGNKRLLIVGDGVLQYLPFAALPLCKDVACNNSKLLVTEHEIVNAPSISTIATLRTEKRDRTPTKTLAAIADPVFNNQDDRCKNLCKQAELLPKVQAKTQVDNLDTRASQRATREAGISKDRLKYSGEEAQNILSLVDPKDRIKKLGFDANREFVMSPELGKYRNILFATHGISDDITPELSGLRLSSIDQTGQPINGFLKLNDIFNLRLSADLVVLSACKTGLGKDVKGEGLLGLTRGFMYAGSPRVVVSLWKVQDDATAVLMTNFYTNMLKHKLKPAEALRKAQLEMSQKGKYTDPYYWAGFTLQGEWQ